MNHEIQSKDHLQPGTGIIYNVTVKLEWQIAPAWLQWLKEVHIPDIISTGCFTHAQVLRLLETDDADGPTFAVQYHAPDRTAYDRYISQFADSMRKLTSDKWGDRLVAFRSVLGIVD